MGQIDTRKINNTRANGLRAVEVEEQMGTIRQIGTEALRQLGHQPIIFSYRYKNGHADDWGNLGTRANRHIGQISLWEWATGTGKTMLGHMAIDSHDH